MKIDDPKVDNLTRSNHFYVAQVSQMEVKISELKALVQAKDSEIDYLRTRLDSEEEKAEEELRNSISVSGDALKVLEARNAILEQENINLKSHLTQLDDFSDIKIQFEHALRMKEIFEEKYRDAKSLLIKAEMTANRKEDKTEIMDISKLKQEFEEELQKIYDEKEFYKTKYEESERKNLDVRYECEMAFEKIKDLESELKLEKSSSLSSSTFSDSQSKSYRSLISKTKDVSQSPAKQQNSQISSPLKSLQTSNSQSNFRMSLSNKLLKSNQDKPPLSKKPDLKLVPNNRDVLEKEIQPLDSTISKAIRTNSIIKNPSKSEDNELLSTSITSLKKENSLKEIDAKFSFPNRNTPTPTNKKVEYTPSSMRNLKSSSFNKSRVVIDLDKNEKIS